MAGKVGQNSRTVFTNLHVIKVGAAIPDVASADGKSTQPAPPRTGGVSSSLTVVMTQCQVEFFNWFSNNGAILKYTLESYKDYQPQDTKVDAACPSATAARGTTVDDIKARWPGLVA